jgi:hypothetical protein
MYMHSRKMNIFIHVLVSNSIHMMEFLSIVNMIGMYTSYVFQLLNSHFEPF